ncbi:MAG: hypothetical protein E7564_09730 [Ruminococcaceae bacterium]|nr:hypothetical protein [Oscillospiraceae bacterium]
MQYVILGSIIILSVLGVLELIRIISYSMTSVPENTFSLIVHIRSMDECEFVIESLIERIKWNSIDFDVIILYSKEYPEIKTIAEKLIYKYNNISLLTYEDLNYNLIIN